MSDSSSKYESHHHSRKSASKLERLMDEYKETLTIKERLPDDLTIHGIENELVTWLDGSHENYKKEIERLEFINETRLRSVELLKLCQIQSIEETQCADIKAIQSNFKSSWNSYKRSLLESVYVKNFKPSRPVFDAAPLDEKLEFKKTEPVTPTRAAKEDLTLMSLEPIKHHSFRNKKSSKNSNMVALPSHASSHPPVNDENKPETKTNKTRSSVKSSENEKTKLISVTCRHGQLRYDGKWYRYGDTVIFENLKGVKSLGNIESVNSREICIIKPDTSKKRIYLAHLRKRKWILHGKNTAFKKNLAEQKSSTITNISSSKGSHKRNVLYEQEKPHMSDDADSEF